MGSERQNLLAVVTYAARHDRALYAAAIPADMHSFLRRSGDWHTALALHQAAVRAAHQADDRLAEAGAVADLGDMQYLTGNYPQATATLRRALKLYRELAPDTRLEQANILTNLGQPLNLTGDTPGAVIHQEQALNLYRQLGDRLGEATALNRLGVLLTFTGPYPAAAAHLLQALEEYRELGNTLGQAQAMSNLGRLQLLTGELGAAAANLAGALELQRKLGSTVGEINTLTTLGALQTMTGDYRTAFASFAHALRSKSPYPRPARRSAGLDASRDPSADDRRPSGRLRQPGQGDRAAPRTGLSPRRGRGP